MREARPAWLLRAALLAGATVIPILWPHNVALAISSREAPRMCATQTESLADQRIAACSTLLSSGRLHGEPQGVAYALRGLAYLDRGDIPRAIADLTQAVALAPEFAPAYQNRGNAWYARGNYGQAMADYDTTIRLDPSSASPFVNRATLRRDLGNTDGALEDFAKAISLNPRNAGAYSGRGELYMRQHNMARAISDLDQAIRLSPSAAAYMLRAQAREEAGNLDQALADYRDASRLDPKRISAMTAEGSIWRKKGDPDKAIAAYDRALAADDKRAATYKLRAEAYAAKGQRKLAMADIGHALKLSWSADLLKTRAALRLDGGDTMGAVNDADAMLKANPNNADAFALRGAAFARRRTTAAHSPISTRRSQPTARTRWVRRARAGLSRQRRRQPCVRRFQPRRLAWRYQLRALSRTRGDLQAEGRYRQGDQRPRCRDQSRSRAGRSLFRARCVTPSRGRTAKALADLNDGLRAIRGMSPACARAPRR